MQKLTERQLKILGTIWGYIRSHGEFPSYSELMEELNLKSKGTIADFFEILESKGYITRQEGIKLTEKAIQHLVDQEVRSLGLEFMPSFDFFSIMTEKEDSTTNVPSISGSESIFIKKEDSIVRKLVDSGLTTNTEMGLSSELNNFVDYLMMGESVGGTKIEVHVGKLVFQNAGGNIINEGNHTETGSRSYKLSVINRLRLNIKAGFDKLLGLFR